MLRLRRTDTRAVLHTLRDDELFSRFLAGDDEAYDVLYERYGARVLNYIRSLLREEAPAADDVFQETFLRLFRERARCRDGRSRPVKNAGGWLFRVARNLTLNHLRSASYLSNMEPGEELLAVPIEESYGPLFGDAIDEDRLIEEVHRIVATLPEALREVFVLREVNGMSYQETAAIVGCSEEAARMRLSRARSAIRRALRPLFVDE